jgi:two-component system, NarL family, sensor histidine kinase BarA
VQLVRKATTLEDIVQSAMESVLPQSLKKNLQLTSEVSRNLKNVIVDADKIRQCVVNLLSNSVKFTPAGGHIVIKAGPAERPPAKSGPFGSAGYFQILVSDNGIGIASELQAKIFETFYQADSSASREYGGAGLGLSIVRSYAEAHGGEVSVRSELGKGATFTLIVPIEPPGTGLEMPRN